MKPTCATTLAVALRGFFMNYLPQQRALSPHTIHSYRDSLRLLLQFVAAKKADPSQVSVEQLTVEQVTAFLQHLETRRHNSARTRNVRLSAVHSFFRCLGAHHPQHLAQAQRLLSIPLSSCVAKDASNGSVHSGRRPRGHCGSIWKPKPSDHKKRAAYSAIGRDTR